MNYVQKLYINIFCTWSKKFVLMMLFFQRSEFVENDPTHSITDRDSWPATWKTGLQDDIDLAGF